jgi:hypothetical protein
MGHFGSISYALKRKGWVRRGGVEAGTSSRRRRKSV